MTALFGDPVIAKGKGFEVKRSELDELVTKFKAAAAAQNMSVPPEIERIALNNLIDERLLLAKATDADRNKGVQMADLQMAALLERVGSQEKLDLLLKTHGVTAAAARQEMAQSVTAKSALERELKADHCDGQRGRKFLRGTPRRFRAAGDGSLVRCFAFEG